MVCRPLLALCLFAIACGDSPRTQARGALAPVAAHLTKLDVLAGHPGGKGWVDGALSAAEFTDPWAIAGDGHGHLYVADANAIRTIDLSAGSVTTLAGLPGTLGNSDGVGAEARFSKPSGLALAGGALYVIDSENDTLRKVDVQSGAVVTLAGAVGVEQTVDAVGSDARFRVPEGLATDGAGHLYIGDTESHVIREMDLASGAVITVAGSAGTNGNVDGVGPAALFDKPKAIAVDAAGNLLVVDSRNRSIRKVDPVTRAVSTLTTFGSPPLGIVVDGTDTLVSLSDAIAGDQRVVRISADGSVSPFAGSTGPPGFVDGAGIAARFDTPSGMWNDGRGVVYLADNGNYVLRAMALSGALVSTLAGARSSGQLDGAAALARFASPQGLAVDDTVAYVADTANQTIRKVTLATGFVTTLAGATGQPGRQDGALKNARFNQPQGLALDPAGRKLYVADTGNRAVRLVDLEGGTVSTLTPTVQPGSRFGGFDAPSGVVFDRGRLFVTDYTDDVVVDIDLQMSRLSILAGQYALPAPVDGVGSMAGFYGPLGIATDGLGHLFIADYQDQTVRSVDVATATVTTLAGEHVTAGANDGVGGAAHFHFPAGVAADAFGHVFVSDQYNDAVRQIDVATGTVTTVIGTLAAPGVRLGPLPAGLAQPTALALTPFGGLLVVSQNTVLIAD